MPGGKLNHGEDPEAGAIREFREETGYDVSNLRALEREEGGLVYSGVIGKKLPITPDAKEIVELRLFSELPSDLSFPLVEYQRMLAAARQTIEKSRL